MLQILQCFELQHEGSGESRALHLLHGHGVPLVVDSLDEPLSVGVHIVPYPDTVHGVCETVGAAIPSPHLLAGHDVVL